MVARDQALSLSSMDAGIYHIGQDTKGQTVQIRLWQSGTIFEFYWKSWGQTVIQLQRGWSRDPEEIPDTDGQKSGNSRRWQNKWIKEITTSEDKLGNKQEQQLRSLCCLCKMCSFRNTLKDPLAKDLGFKEEQTVWGIRGWGVWYLDIMGGYCPIESLMLWG